MEQSISLRKHSTESEHAPLLKSKKALTAFHAKCLELVKDKPNRYLNPQDFTELLGGPTNVAPSFIKELLNIMVANVSGPFVQCLLTFLEFYSIL